MLVTRRDNYLAQGVIVCVCDDSAPPNVTKRINRYHTREQLIHSLPRSFRTESTHSIPSSEVSTGDWADQDQTKS